MGISLGWQEAITGYALHMLGVGIRASTIELRRYQLGRFGRMVAVEPWLVTPAGLVGVGDRGGLGGEHAPVLPDHGPGVLPVGCRGRARRGVPGAVDAACAAGAAEPSTRAGPGLPAGAGSGDRAGAADAALGRGARATPRGDSGGPLPRPGRGPDRLVTAGAWQGRAGAGGAAARRRRRAAAPATGGVRLPRQRRGAPVATVGGTPGLPAARGRLDDTQAAAPRRHGVVGGLRPRRPPRSANCSATRTPRRPGST